MHKSVIAITMVAFAAVGTAGCATKGFVRTQVGQVSEKVDTLSQSLEETQKRTQANETRIGEVDSKAGAAGSAADKAGTAAAAADQRAAAAGQSAQAAQTKANAVEAASKRIVFEVVLNENQGNFKFGKTELPDEAKAAIDQMITQIKANPNGAFFEIEGHTDNAGDPRTNERIGMERAETVKRYLYEQHQIPLHRMNVISYGEDKPAADNKTRDGRAQNRRVVIKVLA
jgi:outer membrane protein OmpA-like peptidoglycan-associated protein